ncbi:unnamed protein product [Didymodactylos carnosus]|uniref:Uncharacterized protein n=1 Tax=Didymodactylos carnosus TaxID=1234261 RepID=A0A8S2UXJ2_9BILA|nr:unnamed protein product [Didymodactylos carnosus]CAF4367470.1 unnamed protein product [Didymodactylos carnosus]
MDFGEFMLEYQNNGIKKSFEIPQANRSGTKSLSNSRKQECYVTPTKQGQFLLINHPTTNSNDERENDQQYPAIVQNQTSLKSCIRDDIVGMSSIKKLQACFIPKPQPELEKKPTLQSLKSAQIQGLNNNKFVNNNNMSTTMPTTMSSANLMSSNLNKDIVNDTLDILQPINDLSSSSSSSSPLQTLFDIARIKTIDRLSKIDSIRTYIEQQLGVTAFLTLYKLLKSQHPIDMKQKPFCHYISYIPHLCALIVLESEQIRKKLK